MKKKLEAELISIAHRILQMKNKSDVNQLYVETQKLYEKLSVLKFVEEHFSEVKPTIGQAEIVEKLEEIKEETPVVELQPEVIQEETIVVNVVPEEVVVEEIIAEEIVIAEEVSEKITPVEIVVTETETETEAVQEVVIVEESKEEVKPPVFNPDFDLEKEAPKKETPHISFDAMLGASFDEALFVKVDHTAAKANSLDFELPKVPQKTAESTEVTKKEKLTVEIEPKIATLNDRLSKGIHVDLNDRLAFVKHLFGNSNEDYMRVLNQLITYDSSEEVHDFIESMVKPDYNNWEGKEEYAQRFIQIIEKKFA